MSTATPQHDTDTSIAHDAIIRWLAAGDPCNAVVAIVAGEVTGRAHDVGDVVIAPDPLRFRDPRDTLGAIDAVLEALSESELGAVYIGGSTDNAARGREAIMQWVRRSLAVLRAQEALERRTSQ